MASTISGPIPPHPYYDKSDPNIYLKPANTRTRPEAEDIARQGRGTLCLTLEVDGHRVTATSKRTSMRRLSYGIKENYC